MPAGAPGAQAGADPAGRGAPGGGEGDAPAGRGRGRGGRGGGGPREFPLPLAGNTFARGGGWSSVMVPMGMGVVDIFRYATVLRDIGFNGPMELQAEYPNGGAQSGADKLTLPREMVIGNLKRDILTIRAAFQQSEPADLLGHPGRRLPRGDAAPGFAAAAGVIRAAACLVRGALAVVLERRLPRRQREPRCGRVIARHTVPSKYI